MRRALRFVAVFAFVVLVGWLAWHTRSSVAQQPAVAPVIAPRSATTQLPLSQVVLFSSGVGYFQREFALEITDTAAEQDDLAERKLCGRGPRRYHRSNRRLLSNAGARVPSEPADQNDEGENGDKAQRAAHGGRPPEQQVEV